MEERLALVNCLTILYYEHFQEAKSTYNDLIKKAIGLIKLPDLVADNDERASVICLRHIINDIIEQDFEINKKAIIQRVRISCPFDHQMLQALQEVLPDSATPAEAARELANFSSQVRLFVNRSEIKKLINRASFAINNDDGTATIKETISTLRKEIEKFDRPAVANGKPLSFVQAVSSEDDDSFTDVFCEMRDELAGAVLKTGWKAVNRMLGIKGGIAPGECIVTPALPHNCKTTFSMALALSMCIFNDASQFVEPGKKPMILDISLENELNVNIPVAYKMLYEHFERQQVDLRKVDPQQASKYIAGRLKERGWVYRFERHISSDFSIETFRQLVNYYESQGYQIVLARVDYLGVADKTGLSNGAIGSEVREMYRRARNICSSKKIALISPHQLSPAAKAMMAMDPGKFIRNLPGKGLYDGCTTVDNEVDLEIFLGIAKNGDKSFLELQRGKHRTLTDTPLKHRYCVLPFAELGIFEWDLEKDYDTSLTSVNAFSMAAEDDLGFLG